MFDSKKITKTIEINGMSCVHCAKKIEDALKSLKGMKQVEVNLEKKQATMIMKQEIDHQIIKDTIEELGYVVGEIYEL